MADANEYDALVQNYKPAKPVDAAPTNEYDNILQARQDDEQLKQALRASMVPAVRSNAQAAGEALGLSRTSNLPPDIVARNLDPVRERARLNEYDGLTQTDPALAHYLSTHPAEAKATHDDLASISAISATAQRLLRTGASAIPKINSALWATGELATKAVVPFVDLAVGNVLPANPLRPVAAFFEDMRKRALGVGEAVAGQVPEAPQGSTAEQWIGGGVDSTIQSMPGLLAAIATRNPAYALAMGGLTQGAPSGVKALDAGKPIGQALAYAAEDATAEIVTELIPMGRLIKDLKLGASLPKVVGNQILREVPTEMVATAWQNANEWANMNPDKPLGKYLEELGPAEAQTVVAVIVQSVLTGGMGKLGNHVLQQRFGIPQQVQTDNEQMAQLLKSVATSQIAKRDVPTVASLVDSVAPEGSVYVDAATFMQQAKAAKLDIVKTMPQTAQNLQEALALGPANDVRIPLSEFASAIPGTTLEQSLIPHAKTDVNGATQAQLADAKWVEDTKKQTEDIIAEQDFTDAWKQSADTVKGELLTQLNTANRFTKDVNEAYAGFMAAFYATQAHRLDITPEEMYVKYPLQIRSAPVTGANTLSQGPALLNVGLNIGTKENALPIADVKAALAEIGVHVSRFANHKSTYTKDGTVVTEHTHVPVLSRALTKQELHNLSVKLNQDVIPQYANGVLTMEGPRPEGYGDPNPEYFYLMNGTKLSELGKTPKVSVNPQQPDALSLRGVHFSHFEALPELRGDKFGTGIKGRERERLQYSKDARIKKRISFYTQEGGVTPTPEAGLGKHEHRAVLTNLYDAKNDPRGIIAGTRSIPDPADRYNAMESAIVDAGYDGYASGGQIVVLNGNVPVQYSRTFNQAGREVKYEGHAGEGGIQKHSIDEFYPWTVRAEGNLDPVMWRAVNLVTEQQGPLRPSYMAAHEDMPVSATLYQDLWYYSELAKQIEAIPDSRIPKDGLPPAEWSKLIWEPETTKTVALRDEKNKPTGETKTVPVAARSPLAGVKPMEIEATGILDWLVLEGSRVPGWEITNADGEVVYTASNRSAAENQLANLEDNSSRKYYMREATGKLTKQDVREFLNEKGVHVNERILRGDEPGNEVEYREGEWQTEEPDEYTLGERARERMFDDEEDTVARMTEMAEQDYATEVEAATEARAQFVVEQGGYWDRALEENLEQEREWYWNDSESPRYMTVTVSIGGNSATYNVNESYGERYITDEDGREVKTGYRDDFEDVIRQHAMEYHDIFPRESAAQYADEGYNTPGGENYFELLLTLPGNHIYSPPHFGDLPDEHTANLLAHIRAAEMRGADGEKVLFIEEIQSDWAQAGHNKKKGFRRELTPEERATKEVRLAELDVAVPHAKARHANIRMEVVDLEAELENDTENADINAKVIDARVRLHKAADELSALLAEKTRISRELVRGTVGEVASAPFVTKTDAWVSLAMKRIIRYASENGFKRVAWTRADQQVERWSALLRKRVDYIEWIKTPDGVHLLGFKNEAEYGKFVIEEHTAQDGTVEYVVHDSTGPASPFFSTRAAANAWKYAQRSPRKVVDTTHKENELSDAIGKAMGKQILESEAQSGVIEDTGITIDNIGMSQTYGDANGLKGDGTPAIYTKVANDVLKKLGGGKVAPVGIPDYSAGSGTAPSMQPGFDITPAVKAKALAGLPLFQPARGQITFADNIKTAPSVITLLANADLSTFLHESGHFYLEVLADMASSQNAPEEVVDDMNHILTWFGLDENLPRGKTPLQAWLAMDMEHKRVYHEQWARGMEAYLFSGKAPNVEMQSLFARFRAWMINVYKQIKALDVTLTPEVEQVMGRLLATNESIAAAQTARSFAPLYDTKPPGMTDDAWKEYQQIGAEATEEAAATLQSRSLRDMQYASNAKAQVLKRLQQQAADKRKAVRAEVTAEVSAEPIYQATTFLKRGEMVSPDGEHIKAEKGFKLDRAALAEMYPQTMNARPDISNLWHLSSKEGLHPNLVAEMFGFKSGDELVRKLLEAEPMQQKIDGMTDQRMLERYGDLADPASMEKAANAAVHNDVRARFVATELRTLDKAVGKRSVLMKMAKEFAEMIIARKRVRDIRPAQYAAAEAKAARSAERAAAKTDLVAAATEKRNQLVNLYAAKAAYDGLAEVDKIVSYAKRVGDSKTIDPEYREQIQALLERFDLRKVSQADAARRHSLVQWIEAQREKNLEPVIDPALENEALRKPYQEMTLEELRGLYDSIRNIEHLGRLKHKLLTLADKRAFQVIVDEAGASIRDNAKRSLPVEIEQDKTWLGRAKKGIVEVFALHRKFANMLREMDGYADGGALQRLLVHSSNKAGATEAALHEAATVKLTEMFKPIFAEGKLNVKTFIPEINTSLSREGRIMVALNTGNDGNLQRLMDGDGWSDKQVQAVVNTLTKTEMDFVQSVWDFVGSYRDAIGAQQKRMTGLEPKWVEARPVMTPHGEYRGGYIPAKYDGTRSTRALSDEAAAGLLDQWRAARGAPTTRASFTKARANKVVNRPLRKDFGVITQHVTDVTHRLAWQDWLVDANRLLRASAIDDAIREHYGHVALATLKKTIEDIAAGPIGAQNALESAVNYIRTGATIAGLGWRLTTSLLQPIGLTQSMVRIGPRWVASGLTEWLGSAAKMENAAKHIYEKSDFMRLRGKTMQREISEIRDMVNNKNSAIEASYFYLIQKMQLVADIPTWLGQYNKAVHFGADEATAVAQADQAVIDAQGNGQIKDLAGVQRGSPYLKLFTNFYSFFNTTYNLTSEAVGRTNFKSATSIGFLAVDMLLLYSVPAALGTLMKWALGDDDDEGKLWRNLVADQLGYLFGTMVGLREIAGSARTALGLPGDYGGPASLRLFGALTALGKQAGQGEADEPFWKALANVAGILFHMPSGQVTATADGIVALADGRTDNPGVLAVGSSKK